MFLYVPVPQPCHTCIPLALRQLLTIRRPTLRPADILTPIYHPHLALDYDERKLFAQTDLYGVSVPSVSFTALA